MVEKKVQRQGEWYWGKFIWQGGREEDEITSENSSEEEGSKEEEGVKDIIESESVETESTDSESTDRATATWRRLKPLLIHLLMKQGVKRMTKFWSFEIFVYFILFCIWSTIKGNKVHFISLRKRV